MSRKIFVYDTTLRDGTQMEGISLSCDDKLRIAQKLDDFGVAYIEGGWPGSNPKDVEFFERAGELTLKHAKITAFGSTCRVDTQPEEDANLQAMLDSGTSVCTVVGKSWDLHVYDVLKTNLDENLRMIGETVGYLREAGRRVFYDAEHFFDGHRADAGYALETLHAAAEAGAEVLVLCDTNGGTVPSEIGGIVGAVDRATPVSVGIHTHNDMETAVAGAIAAVEAGAVHVQGTINGYGERCGNANLCSLIPTLQPFVPGGDPIA